MATKPSKLQVGIIGCGWLGSALAKKLQLNNNHVIVTTTTIAKQPKLTQLGLQNELLTLPDDKEKLCAFNVFKQQQLVICIPPQLKHGKKNYIESIKALVKAANCGNIQQLILISTTAVYRGLGGKINEGSQLNLSDNKVQILALAEQALNNFKGESAIIRFAGLVGKDRHPGNFLAGKTQVVNGDAFVNVIHQQDAVGIIMSLLTSINSTRHYFLQQETIIFNGVSCTHPSRKNFYQQAAKHLQLTQPQFDDSKALAESKIICAKKVKDKLNYQFVYPDLLAWLALNEH